MTIPDKAVMAVASPMSDNKKYSTDQTFDAVTHEVTEDRGIHFILMASQNGSTKYAPLRWPRNLNNASHR